MCITLDLDMNSNFRIKLLTLVTHSPFLTNVHVLMQQCRNGHLYIHEGNEAAGGFPKIRRFLPLPQGMSQKPCPRSLYVATWLTECYQSPDTEA